MHEMYCIKCNRQYSASVPVWRCECGGLLNLEFHAKFPIDKIVKRKPNMWRYREALPISSDLNVISFDAGFTPLLSVNVGDRQILVKQDHLFSTGSYKDRGASVLISKARELGITQVVEDSSGNAGCAIAAYCAKARVSCDIYVPADTAQGKLAQITLYGASLNKIPGSREDTANAVMAAAGKKYYASHSWNPFFFHGTKTFAYEICEQLRWKAPDSVVVPVGNGTLVIGAYLGFADLLTAGIIDRIPKIIAIQAEACAPLAKVFDDELGSLPRILKKDTVAEGIAIAEPIRWLEIVSSVKASKGLFITVNDSEIITALKEMCSKGFYVEPTSAATIAGVKKYIERSKHDEMITTVFTGHGLKSTEKMLKLA